jgi:hypothetical protein
MPDGATEGHRRMDRRGSEDEESEGRTSLTVSGRVGQARAGFPSRRSSRHASCAWVVRTVGIVARVEARNCRWEPAGLSVLRVTLPPAIRERRTSELAGIDSRRSGSAPRGGSRIAMERGMRQIHMDALICRYSELGTKPDSTDVHLWISEHKSAKP